MQNPIQLIFYLFATMAVASAVVVITARHPVRSVLALVVTFFSMAGIWMLLHAEFLALILILVYVGAVMTLFLFIVMMLNVNKETKRTSFVNYLPIGIILSVLLTALMMLAISPKFLGVAEVLPTNHTDQFSNTAQLGNLLYTIYAYPFEISGIILLAAIIAAIVLAQRKPRSKRQNVDAQVRVQPQDRLRIVKMPAVKKPGNIT